jgi:hypothetical protein
VGSRPDELSEIFQFMEFFQPHYALGFSQPLTEMSTRSRKIMFLGSRARPVCRADNLVAIGEPTVWTMWDSSREVQSCKRFVFQEV